jgi:hypothetical protein
MRKLVIVLVVAILLVSDVHGQKKKKKVVRKKEPTTPAPTEDVFQMLEKDEADEAAKRAEMEARLLRLEQQEAQEMNELDDFVDNYGPDPCADKKCGPGRECIPGDKGKARCVCMAKCPEEEDQRRKVCSNYNETWVSDCELYRSRCLCDEADVECTNPLNKHLHIDYYGECREMPSCTEQEMEDFPRRMRDWLFNVMRELADRRELSPYYMQLEREAETSPTESHKTAVAAIWKWCDLDGHPHDRMVSRHELFPIRAPLMALEHCIAPFLDTCDVDNDHRITLKEWGTCLEIPADELLEKCDDVKDAQDMNDEGLEEI